MASSQLIARHARESSGRLAPAAHFAKFESRWIDRLARSIGDLRDTMLYAFDLPELNGEDLPSLPLGNRKVELARLLRRAPAGIVYNEHTDEDGAVAFRHACKLGFEGIVSKRLGAPGRSGPSRGAIKVNNPDSPAMVRYREGRW
jgi:ATP-dependent DNA ligase